MEELIKWYDSNKSNLHPIELATEFHHRFTYIHPFIDGNGRCGRLLMNIILMRNGYPITVIKVEERNEYMRALETASVDNNLNSFLDIVIRAIDRSMDIYLYIAG
jgi:Fic family protein